MKILFKNAKLLHEEKQKHIVVEGEKIIEVSDSLPENEHTFNEILDLDGKLLLSGFTDIHMHLDKSFTYPTIRNRSGTLVEAIEQFQAYEQHMTVDLLVQNMSKSVERAMKHGTTEIGRASCRERVKKRG